MRRSKAYLRQQRADMIAIATRGVANWSKEEKKWTRIANQLSDMFIGDAIPFNVDVVITDFRKWARDAGDNLRHHTKELRKWRAKKI
jgi:hypothetical protein